MKLWPIITLSSGYDFGKVRECVCVCYLPVCQELPGRFKLLLLIVRTKPRVRHEKKWSDFIRLSLYIWQWGQMAKMGQTARNLWAESYAGWIWICDPVICSRVHGSLLFETPPFNKCLYFKTIHLWHNSYIFNTNVCTYIRPPSIHDYSLLAQ